MIDRVKQQAALGWTVRAAVDGAGHPVLVLTLIILVYAGMAVVAFGMLNSRLRRWRAFDATLEQIKKDQACFKEKS